MTIPHPIQIKYFHNIPPNMDQQCDLCPDTASHLIVTVKDIQIIVCQDCFSKMMAIESMLRSTN